MATAGPGARVAATLALLRGVANEIVVALDDRADAEVERAVATVADRVILYPYEEPVDRPVPWLVDECRHEWVLLLDDDQIPSAALIAELPNLVAATEPTHYWIAQRWLYPGASSYIDEPPWNTDYQLRLLRGDRRFVRFSDEFHRPVVADGPGAYVQAPLWHADVLLRSKAERLAKARRYERARPGLRVAGRSMNFAFHVPELESPRHAALPADELEVVQHVLDARAPEAEPRAEISATTRETIDALWPAPEEHYYRARVTVVRAPGRMIAGAQQQLDARVENGGDMHWDWGANAAPAIRIGARWLTLDGAPVAAEPLRTVIPQRLAPGESTILPVHVCAPDEAGRYRLELDLVHEHVRWFEDPAVLEVEVVPRRVAALVRASESDILALLETRPEIEPLLVETVAGHVLPAGYPRTRGVGHYLVEDAPDAGPRLALVAARRTLPLLRAARRMRRGNTSGPLRRDGDAFLAELARCEFVAVLPGKLPTLARERYELWLMLRAARVLGVRTAIHVDVAGDDRNGRMLRRVADATFADIRELIS